jgi:hypothetical protein
MKEETGQFHEKDKLSDIWSEAYRDWVDDWSDAYRKDRENPLSCCGSEPTEGKIIFPIDIT